MLKLECFYLYDNKELKKRRRRRRVQERHLKSEFARPRTFWSNVCNFLNLNSKGLCQSSGKEKESCCLVFQSSTKREIRHFPVVVVQRRLAKKRDARAKLLFCQSKPITFLQFSLSSPSPSSLLKFPIKVFKTLKFYRKGDKTCVFFVPSGPLYQAKAKSTRNRTFFKLHIFLSGFVWTRP